MPKKEERYTENLPKKSYIEKQEDYQWRESKHRRRELFHEDVYFGYEEYIECELNENKPIQISPQESEELNKLIRRRKNLRLQSLNIKPEAGSTIEVPMESNTRKISEDSDDTRETKQNQDKRSGNGLTHKMVEDAQLDGSNDIKALPKDKTPKSQPNKRRASVCDEMQNDNKSQKPSVTENEGKARTEEELKSVNRDSDKTSEKKAYPNGKSKVNQPAADRGIDQAYAKGECRQRKKSKEEPAQPVAPDDESKGSEGVFGSFKNLMRGMF